MRTKDHKIICVNSVVHKSPASHAATVCVCVSVLVFSYLCSFGTVRRVSTSGLQSAELQLMLDHCRTVSVTLACKSRPSFLCF